MPNLTWTRERPTAPGWYWWREKIHTCPDWIVRVVEIIEYPIGTLYVMGHGLSTRLDGEWAGPIPQPEETRRYGRGRKFSG